MFQVALTGGIGSGKSLIARMLGILGVPVFEADAEAKRSMARDPGLKEALRGRFGDDILINDELDRKALAQLVFNDPAALADLNALVHPVVRSAFKEWAAARQERYVVMEAAILTETGGHRMFDRVVVVAAPEELRIRRVMARDDVAREDVLARMRNQATEEERLAIAHHVIVNDDSRLVIPQVLAVHQKILDAAE